MLNGNSVNGILKVFDKAITQLDKLNEVKKEEVKKIEAEQIRLGNKKLDADAEASRASSVADKLRAIIEA